MNVPKFEIEPKRFYLVGKYLFFIGGIIGLVRILDLWSQFKAYDVISSLGSALFQFALFLFFAHLQGKEEKGEVRELNDGEIFKMQDALDKLNLEDKNGKKRY